MKQPSKSNATRARRRSEEIRLDIEFSARAARAAEHSERGVGTRRASPDGARGGSPSLSLTGAPAPRMRAGMAVEHRFVETNGIRLHCAVDGEGPLVILLHGFPECWYSWRHQIAALAPRFRVVAPDLRGYNESDKPAGVAAYALPELVADVPGLIEAFGEREAAIVGHDWGGAIAWTFAMDHPEPTRRLVVLNCPHPAIFAQHLRANGRQLARSWYMFFFQLPWLPEAVLRAGHGWAVGSPIPRSAVRQDAITTQDP